MSISKARRLRCLLGLVCAGALTQACVGKQRPFASDDEPAATDPGSVESSSDGQPVPPFVSGEIGATASPTGESAEEISEAGLIGAQVGAKAGDSCSLAATACSDGAQLLACSNGIFVVQEACPAVCRIVGGQATCLADCEPDSRRCSDDGTPQFCDLNRTWQSDVSCPFEKPVCVDGSCAVCLPNTRQCSTEGIPEVCAPDGSAWAVSEPCLGENALCVPETGQCGQCSPGDVRACVGALGNCSAGEQGCQSDTTWGPCSILPQAADSCAPGDDASCDGSPNGGCTCTLDVSCGPVQEVGTCRFGVSDCVNGIPGLCQGAILPGPRDCTSPFDNDCDGLPDDALDENCQCEVGDDEVCGTHPDKDGQGVCRAGTRSCIASAGSLATRWGSCQGSVGPRSRDCRSALDNDCDGVRDDTLDSSCQCQPGMERDCGTEPGSFNCASGKQICETTNGGTQSRWGACRYAPVANGTRCSDDDSLTFGDSCQDGACSGLAWGSLAIGNGGLCAIRSAGVVWCWEGIGFSGIRNEPAQIGLPMPARSVTVGTRQACAVLENAVPMCWGSNDSGQLGTGNTNSAPSSSPNRVSELSSSRIVVAGAEGTTALDGAGAPFVWGTPPGAIYLRSDFGFSSLIPVRTTTLSSATMLALGARHACVLLPDGEVSCWGQNEFLQRGSGVRNASVAFSPVPSLNDAILIESGQTSTCVVRETGNVSCWGAFGCLSTPCGNEPANVPNLVDALQVSIGGDTACALKAGGGVVCWGRLDLPPLGGLEDVTAPTSVPDLNDAVLLAATDEIDGHCALRRSGGIVCWDETLDLDPVTTLPN